MYEYDDIGRRVREMEEATRLARDPGLANTVREMEEAMRFARDPGLADTARRIAEQHPAIHDTAMREANEAAARLRDEPTRQVLREDPAQRLQDFDRIRAQVEALPDVSVGALPNANIGALPKVHIAALPNVNADALASAERLAAQALKSYSPPDFGDLLPKNLDQFQDLIDRATRLATAPSTQELLRSVDEVMAAARGVPVEEQPLGNVDPEDFPNIPELNWMLHLDRDSLVSLCRLLYHLTFVPRRPRHLRWSRRWSPSR